MRIAVLKERAAGERRVAATPETVKKFIALGASVAVESGAGEGAGIADADYREAGAEVGSAAEALKGAEIVLGVQAPDPADLAAASTGAWVAATFDPFGNRERFEPGLGVRLDPLAVAERIEGRGDPRTLVGRGEVGGIGRLHSEHDVRALERFGGRADLGPRLAIVGIGNPGALARPGFDRDGRAERGELPDRFGGGGDAAFVRGPFLENRDPHLPLPSYAGQEMIRITNSVIRAAIGTVHLSSVTNPP